MKTMLSLKRHRYGGRVIEKGVEFRVGKADEKTLIALGRAKHIVPALALAAAPEQEPEPAPYGRRDLAAEGTAPSQRAYRRRDQTAAR